MEQSRKVAAKCRRLISNDFYISHDARTCTSLFVRGKQGFDLAELNEVRVGDALAQRLQVVGAELNLSFNVAVHKIFLSDDVVRCCRFAPQIFRQMPPTQGWHHFLLARHCRLIY